MAIEQAWLLKGWLLGQSAPQEITKAIEEVIAALRVPLASSSVASEVLSRNEPVVIPDTESTDITGTTLISDIIGPKQRKPWSPEAKAAAADRMRKRIAAGKMGRKPATENVATPKEAAPEFAEAERRITVPAPRRKSTLTDSDWPEIKRMLAAGKSRTTIASDFDEEPEDLDFFMVSCQRREQSEGNFAAPLGGA